MILKLSIANILLALFVSNLAVAQTEAGDSNSQQESETPYEVVITGQPSKAYYRELIQKVEEDYFARFNELNTDDMYDMYCYEYTPTMSHIRKRACEPLFMIRQRAADGANLAFSFSTGGVEWGIADAIGSVQNESEVVRQNNRKRNYDALVQKIEELTLADKQLGEIANVMAQLKNRLESYSGN
ncbi:MAG: hypothetical protein R3F50_08175 [Gammaproteobacteria bacterium]